MHEAVNPAAPVNCRVIGGLLADGGQDAQGLFRFDSASDDVSRNRQFGAIAIPGALLGIPEAVDRVETALGGQPEDGAGDLAGFRIGDHPVFLHDAGHPVHVREGKGRGEAAGSHKEQAENYEVASHGLVPFHVWDRFIRPSSIEEYRTTFSECQAGLERNE